MQDYSGLNEMTFTLTNNFLLLYAQKNEELFQTGNLHSQSSSRAGVSRLCTEQEIRQIVQTLSLLGSSFGLCQLISCTTEHGLIYHESIQSYKLEVKPRAAQVEPLEVAVWGK